MSLFHLTPAKAARLRTFRRNTWKAIVLCAALRLANAALEPGTTHAMPSSEPAIMVDRTP